MTLQCSNIRFKYSSGGRELFGGVSYSFGAGMMTALTGPSGSGKSTLLYILSLMLAPADGQITWHGESIADLPDAKRSRFRANHLGFVFQDSELDAFRPILDSVIEPGLYSGRKRSELVERAQALLESVGLEQIANSTPTKISGGQGQRAALCRALINDPDIILADEPTGNLDRENAIAVLHHLRGSARSGKTVVIATHDPYVIDSCDAVFNLEVFNENA